MTGYPAMICLIWEEGGVGGLCREDLNSQCCLLLTDSVRGTIVSSELFTTRRGNSILFLSLLPLAPL